MVKKMVSLKVVLALLMVACCSVGGCVLAPGMQEGISAQTSEGVIRQFDIYPINVETLRRLNDRPVIEVAESDTRNASLSKLQYRIGPQDILRITVWDHPELNNPAGITQPDAAGRVVNDDGTLFYPYVGLIYVTGKSVQEVRAYLQKALVASLRDPQVDVAIQSFRSQKIIITGEVKAAGTQQISDVPLRVLDSISAAGGPTNDADLDNLTLTREGKTNTINLYRMMYQGKFDQNFVLKDGDVLNLPDHRAKEVFVLGEVVRPAPLPMPRGQYTLAQALADAGGVSQLTANPRQIYVIRGEVERTLIFQLDAHAPDALILADRFNLNPRDVVFVDAAEVARVGRVLNQVLSTAEIYQSVRAVP